MNNKSNKHLVYSTQSGRLCPACGQPVSNCVCKSLQNKVILGDEKVKIQRETKGRKGKGVTLISGLPLSEDDLKNLAKNLKQLCGCGGAVKDGVIEIQGDKRDDVFAALVKAGYQPKKV